MRGARLTGAAVFLALAFAGSARAATINVTTTADSVPGSLRQAIMSAGDGDTVSVPAGHYTLTGGQIPVAHAITIAGAGASSTIFDANHAGRVFDVTSTGKVAIENVTIENGSVNVASTFTTGGGGVLEASPSGDLMLAGDTLSGNAVTGGGGSATNQGGGAVYFDGNALTVTNSVLTGNSVNLSGSANNNGGGAIYEVNTTLAVTNSTLSNNSFTIGPAGTTSNNGGGAIYEDASGLTLSSSTMMGNSASISGGTTDNGGGGLYEDGSKLAISSSSVSSNHLTISGGTINNGGGGIYNNGGPVGITTSTVASNAATLTGTTNFSGGGGIFNNGHVPTLVNVTLSDNDLSAPSALNVGGGGFFQNGAPGGTFTNTTVADNQSNQIAGGVLSGTTLTFKNTIFAGNSASSGHANCDGPMSDISAGYNLEDTTPATCWTSSKTGDLAGVAAGLGPLQDNGGPGPTHALLAGSVAIDHIPAAQCTDQQTTPQPVSTDERGVPRSLDGSCDVGAYEFAPADLGATASATPSSIVVGQNSTATFTVANSGPAPSTGTTLKVTVPSGLNLVSLTPSQGTCSGTTCSLGVVGPGASAHVAVAVTGTHTGSQSISASANATEPDPTAADNTTSATITVSPPTLSQLKVKPKSFKRHAQVSYTLNAAASVKFTVQRCTRSSHKPHRLRCKKLFSFTLNGTVGSNTVQLKRRLHGHKLKPGSYRLVATPAIGGTTGSSVSASFRVR